MSSAELAFPMPASETSQGGHFEQYGMTLRDYFAAAALTGFMSNPNIRKSKIDNTWDAAVCAQHAFTLADEMLKARAHARCEQTPQEPK